MIGIQLVDSGEFLDLFPNTVVNVQAVNPIFADGNTIPGTISIPFDVPMGIDSTKNARLLFHPDVVTQVISQRTLKARLYFDGVLYKTGNLQVFKPTPSANKTSVNFIFGLPTLANNFANLKIRYICTKAYTLATASYTKSANISVLTSALVTPSFSIKINDIVYTYTSFGPDMPSGYHGEVNGVLYNSTSSVAIIAFYDIMAQAIAVSDFSVTATAAASYCSIKPTSFATDITSPIYINLPDGITYNPWTIDTSLFDSDYADEIRTFLSGYVTAPADDAIRFPWLYNPGMYSNVEKQTPLATFDFINYVESGAYWVNKASLGIAGYFYPNNRTSVAPHVRLQWVLETLATFLGIGLEGDFLSDADYSKALFTHSNSLDVTGLKFIGPTDYLYCRRSFDANEFLPDITISDLFTAIQNRFNLSVYYNDKSYSLRLQKRDGIITNATYQEITDKCAPIKEMDSTSIFGQFNIDSSQGLTLLGAKDDADLNAIPIDTYVIGGGGTEIDTSLIAASLQQSISYFIPGVGAAGPVSLPSFNRPADVAIPTIMIFEKPGDPTLANIFLQSGDFFFAGGSGLGELRWKNWLRFLLNRQTVYTDINFEFRDLLSIDWEKKYRLDRVNYFISTLDIKMTMIGIDITPAELFPTGVGVLP